MGWILTPEDEVLTAMDDGPVSINSIMMTTGLTRQEVLSTLRKLRDEGKVSSRGYTWWVFEDGFE